MGFNSAFKGLIVLFLNFRHWFRRIEKTPRSQQATRPTHLATTVQITVSLVELRLSFRAAGCVAVPCRGVQ